MLILRIIFTVLSAVCLGALIPIATFGWQYAVLCGVCAFFFFLLMLICKQSQEFKEAKKQEKNGDSPDFISNTSQKQD